MSLRDELQAIYDQHGKLTPELVVDEARSKDSPLHASVFDRTKGEAAEAWYRHRAHELIKSVKVVYLEGTDKDPALSVRAFHAVNREDGYSYEPVGKVAHDPFTRQILLRDMEREWKQLLARYEQFQEFLAIVSSDIDKREPVAA